MGQLLRASFVYGSVLIISTAIVTAATKGDIIIKGEVPVRSTISVSDSQAETDLNQLGQVAYTNHKVGEIVLDSNHENSFKITLISPNNGFLAKSSGGQQDDERIAYSVSLSNPSGTLGNNITEPSLSELQPKNGQGLDLIFSGTAVSPTVGRKYDVAINTGIKGLKPGQDYTDTLTIQITNL